MLDNILLAFISLISIFIIGIGLFNKIFKCRLIHGDFGQTLQDLENPYKRYCPKCKISYYMSGIAG